MKINHFNIYNNLIRLTRNKKLYLNLENEETFSDRLILLFFHIAFFLKHFKSEIPKKNLQELFDYIIFQVEISIREIGYGDASVNKKMKEFIHLFYAIIDKIETLDLNNNKNQIFLFKYFLNIKKNLNFYANYFNNYRIFLSKNTLKNFTKDIINLNF